MFVCAYEITGYRLLHVWILDTSSTVIKRLCVWPFVPLKRIETSYFQWTWVPVCFGNWSAQLIRARSEKASESWQDVKASVSKEVEACSLSGATVNQMRFEVIQDVFRTQGESLSYKLFVFYLSSSILGWRSERTLPTNIKCAFWVFFMFLFAGQIIIEECLPSIEGVKMNWSES